MRIGCLQFAPQVGDIENNLNRADAVLSKADPEDLDLLVLPELAFTGYNFRSLQEISPFLEPSGSGITSLWARTMALKYNCNVSVGYPEKVDVSGKWPTGPEYYNSNIVVNGDGETIANYRKSFLYHTDQTWALEGQGGFYDGWIPGLGNTSIGICMDLNPYKFEAPWDAFEFGFHILESNSNLVIVSMAWMTREEPRRFSRMPQEPDMDTLTYWVTRLEPLIRADTEDEIIVVFCNRTGSEDEAMYAGTSAVIGIREGEVKVYGLLGRGSKELLVVDTSNAPFARLVYRPDSFTGKATGDGGLKDSIIPVPLDTPPISEADVDKEKAKESNITPNTAIAEKFPGPPTPADDNKATPTQSPLQRRHTEPPVPPPAPNLPETSSKALKKHNIAPIQVHNRPARIYDPDSARSPGSLSNFPTPSAPSPTPMSLRPKLVIPQSPPIQAHQYPADTLYSASSEISHHSLQSVKSNESEASIQTVKSNPRPPEDSTPFPHSGLPLSGYPANSHQGRKIYGGHVDISHLDSFSPTTPFDDISPISTNWHWRNPDSTLRTPISGGGWMTGTPIGRHPEPFQWPVIQAIRVVNNPEKKEEQQVSDTTSQNDKEKEIQQLDENAGAQEAATQSQNPQNQMVVERPPSPKSRNASRSGRHERSNSTVSQQEIKTAASQHLESIARRARSRSHTRTTTPGIERQTTSRADNRTPMQDFEDSLSPAAHGTGRFAPSPNLFDRNRPGAPVIPTPAALDYYRTVPEGRTQRSRSGTRMEQPLNFSSPATNGKRSMVRIPSRGRRPEPREHIEASGVRSSSADSTKNDVLHRKESAKPGRHHNERHSSKTSHSRGQRRPSNGPDMQNFERVEAVLCPSCPVHGRRSESARNARHSSSSNEDQPLQRKRSDSVGHVPLLLPSTTYQPPPRDSLPLAATPQAGPSSIKHAARNTLEESTPITPKAPRQADFPADVHQIAEAIPRPPDRPGTAPLRFDPVTPKAMVFDIRKVNSEPASAEPHNLSFAASQRDEGKTALVS